MPPAPQHDDGQRRIHPADGVKTRQLPGSGIPKPLYCCGMASPNSPVRAPQPGSGELPAASLFVRRTAQGARSSCCSRARTSVVCAARSQTA